LQIVQGKESFGKITVGVDPGEVFGLAVLAGGRVVETENCYSLDETVRRIEKVVKDLGKMAICSITVKIGDGVPACKEKLLNALDSILPQHVTLESVKEAGTDSQLDEAKHRRGLRDIVSAIKIAGRNGIIVQRGVSSESRS
jgi:predicted RNase H-like nuclease (RuvC/YqgF family)